MKNKFKVGDIIRGTKESDREYTMTNSNMTKAKVEEVFPNGMIRIGVIEHKDDTYNGCTYRVYSKYFERVKPETIVIYHKDRDVIALDKSSGKKGIARCNPADKFDFMTGAKLAFERLTGIQINDDYLNTKVVFDKSSYSDIDGTILIKAGKVYEIKKGKFYNEGGNLLPTNGSFRNMEDVRAYFGGTPTEHFGDISIIYDYGEQLLPVEIKE